MSGYGIKDFILNMKKNKRKQRARKKKNNKIQNGIDNQITLKIKYECDENTYTNILSDMKNYTNLVHCTYHKIYNEYPNSISTKELTQYQKTLKNIYLDSHFKNSAIYEARALISKAKTDLETYNNSKKVNKYSKKKNKKVALLYKQNLPKICFGGKKLYTDYQKGLITKEELDVQKLLPIFSVGSAQDDCNRKFELINSNTEDEDEIEIKTILYRPSNDRRFILELEDYKNYKELLEIAYQYQQLNNKKDERKLPITYRLDLEYIYITFNLNKIKKPNKYKPMQNRILAIDMNPNYIGWVVIEWINEFEYKIINKGVLATEVINTWDNSLKGKGFSSDSKLRKHIANKRRHEVKNIAQHLVKLAKHYKCRIFGLEDLSFNKDSEDPDKSHYFKKLVHNQWCRTLFIQQITKHCKQNKIKIQVTIPEYSSILGNLLYHKENLPDMINAAIEISRRVNEYELQYHKKIKQTKSCIRFPDLGLVSSHIADALKVVGYQGEFKSLKSLCIGLKKSGLKYRVPLESVHSKVFRLSSRKSLINSYDFNVEEINNLTFFTLYIIMELYKDKSFINL